MFDTQPSREEILALITPLKDQPGPLLVMLHAIQTQAGYVPASVIPVLADELNLSRAEVQGVVSFYHHFRGRPPGCASKSAVRNPVKRCTATAWRRMLNSEPSCGSENPAPTAACRCIRCIAWGCARRRPHS